MSNYPDGYREPPSFDDIIHSYEQQLSEAKAEIERLTEQLRRSEECLLYERNRLSYANDCIDELQDKLTNAEIQSTLSGNAGIKGVRND